MNLSQFQKTYFEECGELLGEIEERLLVLSNGDYDMEDLHALFRAVHSIKGGAGAFGFEALVRYAHTFETLLDSLRGGTVAVSRHAVDVLIRARDVLEELVLAAQSGTELPDNFGQDVADELKHLMSSEAVSGKAETSAAAAPSKPAAPAAAEEARAASAGGSEAAPAPPPASPAASPTPAPEPLQAAASSPAGAIAESGGAAAAAAGSGGRSRFHIHFAPDPDLYRKANEPLLLVRELLSLGLVRVTAHLDDIPPLDALDPEGAYLAWDFDLWTEENEERIREVFEFVEGDCVLEIERVADDGMTAPPSAPGAAGQPVGAPEASARSEAGHGYTPPALAASGQEEAMAPDATAAVADNSAPSGTAVAPAGEGASEDIARPALSSAMPQARPGRGNQTTIRVDLEKIDRLVNMVGEIVITQAMLSQQAMDLSVDQHASLIQGVEELAQHTRELQEAVMSVRAQSVKAVFARMARLVHDVAPQLGKDIRLIVTGEDTEVDKTVIEQLADPLTHMVRNSIDHGIETPEQREAKGKPAQGVVHLSAAQRGGRIVIEVADDGAGIDRERVRRKGIEKGIISTDAELTDEQIDNLLFAPGLSTADKVSDLSGRGVGMDVVRRNIQALGGRISVQSQPGWGSRFILTLPLTLAVLDGMIIAVGNETYVLPLSSIIESLRPSRNDINRLVNSSDLLSIRGDFVPLIYLHELFGVEKAVHDPSEGLVVLVDVEGGGRVGLVIDEMLGQQQVVIKSLESNYRPVSGVSGATILGDGRVALILDTGSIAAMWAHADSGTTRSGSDKRLEAHTAALPPPSPELQS